MIWMAWLLGLASTAHCWGMCGGLVVAFSAVPTAGERTFDSGAAWHRAMAFNAGRLTAYILLGALCGASGAGLLSALPDVMGHSTLETAAALFMVLSGLAMLGRLPGHLQLETLGLKLWRATRPLTSALLPATSVPRRFLLGGLWGLVPCGLVYSMLTLAATRGSASEGAQLMAAFGVGTLPGMLAAFRGLDWVRARLRGLNLKSIAAWLLIIGGVVLLCLPAASNWQHAH
jgi:uncharacterized protein